MSDYGPDDDWRLEAVHNDDTSGQIMIASIITLIEDNAGVLVLDGNRVRRIMHDDIVRTVTVNVDKETGQMTISLGAPDHLNPAPVSRVQ